VYKSYANGFISKILLSIDIMLWDILIVKVQRQ
jgi:hypothetical protein